MAYFRYKQKFEKFDATLKTPYGHEYFVFDGFLFIPDDRRMDIMFAKKRNYVFINHIEVPCETKNRFNEKYPQWANELHLPKKDKVHAKNS